MVILRYIAKQYTNHPSLWAGLAILLLVACQNTSGEIEGKVSDGINGTTPSGSGTWSFLSSGDYTYNPNHLSFASGNVSLKSVNTTFNSAATFATGTYSGISYSSGSMKLDAAANTALSSSWAPRYSHLVGYWKMDGDWSDSSGNGGTGTSTNAPIFSTIARVGSNSGLFDDDAAYQYVTIPNSSVLENVQEGSYSIQAWYRPTSYPNATVNRNMVHALLAKPGNNLGLLYNSGGNFLFQNYTNASASKVALSATTYPPGAWYHVMGVYDSANAVAKIYINGALAGSVGMAGFTPYEYGTAPWRIGAAQNSALDTDYGSFADGRIDDAAIWNTALSAGDVALIYHRQKQKYAGSYQSAVIELGASAPWEKLTPVHSLPFFKELPSTSETLSPALTTGVIGTWHFNETSLNTLPAGADFADSSGRGQHISTAGGLNVNGAGKFVRGAKFSGANPYGTISLGSTLIPADATGLTVSAWVKPSDLSTDQRLFTLPRSNVSTAIGLAQGRTANKFGAFFKDNADALVELTSASTYSENEWHHVVLSLSNGSAVLYVNGVAAANQGANTVSLANSLNSSATLSARIGTIPASTANFFMGDMDELALWKRSLSAGEVLELYRRGANRVKYQARSCVDASCNCTSLGAGGSATDCSGDGTANDLVGTDPLQAHGSNWLGPDGSATTYFSELHNNSAVNASGEPTGAVGTGALALDWTTALFPNGAKPINNPYFQFRVLMESDDELNACSGSACMPEITSVVVAPTGRYYGGGASIENNTPLTFSQISDLSKSESSACTKYQLSTDGGATWLYWNGAAWSPAAGGLAQSNFFSDFSGKLGLLTAGNFKFKAFLTTNTSGDFLSSCSLHSVSVTFSP